MVRKYHELGIGGQWRTNKHVSTCSIPTTPWRCLGYSPYPWEVWSESSIRGHRTRYRGRWLHSTPLDIWEIWSNKCLDTTVLASWMDWSNICFQRFGVLGVISTRVTGYYSWSNSIRSQWRTKWHVGIWVTLMIQKVAWVGYQGSTNYLWSKVAQVGYWSQWHNNRHSGTYSILKGNP